MKIEKNGPKIINLPDYKCIVLLENENKHFVSNFKHLRTVRSKFLVSRFYMRCKKLSTVISSTPVIIIIKKKGPSWIKNTCIVIWMYLHNNFNLYYFLRELRSAYKERIFSKFGIVCTEHDL